MTLRPVLRPTGSHSSTRAARRTHRVPATVLAAVLSGAPLTTVLLAAPPADAATTRLIQGVVVDQSGRAVDDVLVEAVDENGDVAASAFTYASQWADGPQHGYFFLEVPAGYYTVELSRAGYRPAEVDDVQVTRRHGAALGEVEVKRRQAPSTTTATLVDPTVTTADDVLVRVQVSTDATDRPTGTVVASEGRRRLDDVDLRPSRHGRAVLDLGQLRRGTHLVQVTYGGDALTRGSVSRTVTIRVERYSRGRAARTVATAW